MKRFVIALLVCLAAGGATLAAPADGAKALNVRTFQFKYKDADRAAGIIKPLLSAEGSMSIQPSTNALVVTDRAENLKSVAAALSAFDAPAQTIKLSLHLVAAAHAENAAAPPPELREIAAKLAIIRYNAVESLGEANVEAREGEPVSVQLSNGYRADFKFGEIDPTSNSVRLNDFKLSRNQNDQLTQLYTASLNVTIGQRLMFGVTKTQGQRALFLVCVAHR